MPNQAPQVAQNGQRTDIAQTRNNLKSLLAEPSIQAKFQQALGGKVAGDKFIASISEAVASVKDLASCDPKLIMVEALKAATLSLPINKQLGFSYILVFKNSVKQPDGTWAKIPTPTMVIGYKGYIQLAERSGQYRVLNADVVFEGELQSTDKLSGAINLNGTRTSNKVVGYFAHFELINGFKKTLYITLEEMVNYALRYSPSFKGKNPPTKEALMEIAQRQEDTNSVGESQGWTGDFRSMALKVCISQLLRKYGILSIEMQDVLSDELKQEQTRDEEIASNANVEDIEAEEVKPSTETPANGCPV